MARSHWMPLVLLFALLDIAAAQPPPADATFDRIRRLEGKWQGTAQWLGTGSGPSKLSASYYLTGNGSAVVEDLIMGPAPAMTTVYHRDGRELRITHFCAAANQPRLKATRFDNSRNSVEFSFVDATGLDPAKPAHVEKLLLRFLADDHITLDFTFGGNGTQKVEHIDLTRQR